MSRYETFDDFLATEQLYDGFQMTPFFVREDKTEEGTLHWLNENYDNKEQTAHSRLITWRRYIALYKGIHWRYFDVRDSQRDYEYNPRRPKMVSNYAYEMVEQRVAQMARLNTAFTALPHTQAQEDQNAARASELMLKARSHELDFEGIKMEHDRIKSIYGTGALVICWDPDCGPLLPASVREMAKKKKGAEVRIGDVVVKAMTPDRIFPQIGCNRWEDVYEWDTLDWMHVEVLRHRYPKLRDKIQPSKKRKFDYEYMEVERPDEMVMVREFFHLPTKELPEGAYIKYTDDVILEWTEYPYAHGKMNMIIEKDIEVPGELWGRSFFTHIEQLQRFTNNVLSSVARDYGVASAPKWMMPKGACDIHDLNNEATIVEYRGPVAPRLEVHNPTGSQSFQVMEYLESRIGKLSSVYDVSRGEVPSGVTANSALRFLDEQESQRLVVAEKRRKRAVIDTYKMMLETMKQYYQDSDERMIRYVGQDNSYTIESFKTADFQKVYDIRIQNTSALPDTKTGKISAIIDLNMATQTDPVFRREEVIRMLDLGMDETYKDQATASLDAAKTTLNMLLKGEEVPEPKIWEDLIVHHTVFYREMQKPTYRMQVPEEIQLAIEARMKIMEGLMWLRSKDNQKFAMQLSQIEYFPLFFTVPPQPAPMAPGMEGQPGGIDAQKIAPTAQKLMDQEAKEQQGE